MHSFKQVVVLPWGIKKLEPTKSFERIKSFVQKVLKHEVENITEMELKL